jgi:hypothetical protein
LLPAGTLVAVVAVGAVGLSQSLSSGGSTAATAGVALPGVTPPSIPGPSVLATPASAAPASAAAPTPAASTPAPAKPRPRRHRAADALRIRSTGPACYVQVTRKSGRLAVRRIIHGHQTLRFRRPGLDVVLGNAGGVVVAVSGHRPHRAGRSGQVVHFHVP